MKYSFEKWIVSILSLRYLFENVKCIWFLQVIMYIRYFFKYLAHLWLGVPICGSIFENTVELLSPLPVAFEHWWASAHRHAVCGACGEVLRIKHRYIYNTVFIFYMYIGNNMGKTSACQGGALRRGSCGNNLFGKFRGRGRGPARTRIRVIPVGRGHRWPALTSRRSIR